MVTLIVVLAGITSVALAVVPLLIAAYAWRIRSKHMGQAAAPLGSALQELDRLVARPSVEYRMELESQVKAVNDDQGSE
jgi:hypothetical protein